VASGCLHRDRGLGAADDALQTALLRLSRHWHRLRPETFRAYAKKAVVNASIDEVRRSHRSHEVLLDRPLVDRPVDTPGVEVGRADVRKALMALPPAQRSVLALRYFGDCSVDETAQLLGISVETVASQSSRALTALRRALSKVPNHQERKQ
jgi:RNA polymerase sigma factor (sigma-70 family)